MKYKNSIKNYNINGFVVIKRSFPRKIFKNYTRSRNNYKFTKKTKDRKFFHRTKDGKINTIHNVQEFYKRNKIKNIINKVKLSYCLKIFLVITIKLEILNFS